VVDLLPEVVVEPWVCRIRSSKITIGSKENAATTATEERNTHTNHSQMAPIHALGTSGQDRNDDMKKMGEVNEMQEALEVKKSTKHDPS
jgi:hypothetical protein